MNQQANQRQDLAQQHINVYLRSMFVKNQEKEFETRELTKYEVSRTSTLLCRRRLRERCILRFRTNFVLL